MAYERLPLFGSSRGIRVHIRPNQKAFSPSFLPGAVRVWRLLFPSVLGSRRTLWPWLFCAVCANGCLWLMDIIPDTRCKPQSPSPPLPPSFPGKEVRSRSGLPDIPHEGNPRFDNPGFHMPFADGRAPDNADCIPYPFSPYRQ